MMKKTCALLMILLLLLNAFALAEPLPEPCNPIPEEIASLFDIPAWEGYEIPRVTGLEEYNAFVQDGRAALVILRKERKNVLCLVEMQEDGTWCVTGRNHQALPLSDSVPYLYAEIPGQLEVYLHGEDPGMLFFVEEDGEWVIDYVNREKTNLHAYVRENALRYYFYTSGTDGYPEVTDVQEVRGVFARGFEQFQWAYFPQSPEEAAQRLSFAPALPTSGSPFALTGANVSLRPGEKYDVYAAPGRDSWRAANGKAVMSTNDWVQVFGQEDGWALVQYDVSDRQMRFGYIDVSALPGDAEVPELVWEGTPLRVRRKTSLTDDPLGQQGASLITLEPGAEVTRLATLGPWYYVETTTKSGQMVRGFLTDTTVEEITDIESLNPNG